MSDRSGRSLTRAQVREVDRRAIELYEIPGIVLMENAGRNAAGIIVEATTPDAQIGIICGGGNNGGDGFVIARHLSNAGRLVEVFLASNPAKLSGDALTNFRIMELMGVRLTPLLTEEHVRTNASRLHQAHTIVDAVLGTGFTGEVRPPLDAVLGAINAAKPVRIAAIDIPSGLDCDSGRAGTATVRADYTITFMARKTGFDVPGVAQYTGTVHVVDIGAPPRLIDEAIEQFP